MENNKTEDLKSVISGIQLSPEQGEAVHKCLVNYLNDWKQKIEEKVFEDINRQLLTEYNGRAQKFEKNLRSSMTEELTESLTKELTEKITADLKNQYSKDLKEAVSTLNEYFSTKFELFCQEATKEIEESLKEDISASPEQRAFSQILGTVQPFVEMSDNTRAVEIMEKQDKTIKELVHKLNEMTKEKTIAELVSYLPEEYQETMRKLLSEAKNAEEVVDKYERACEFIKNTTEILDSDKTVKSSPVAEEKKPDSKEIVSENAVADDFFEIEDDNIEVPVKEEIVAQDTFNDDIEEDYFDDTIETVTESSVNEEEEVKDERAADSKKSLTESQSKIMHLAELG